MREKERAFTNNVEGDPSIKSSLMWGQKIVTWEEFLHSLSLLANKGIALNLSWSD